MSGDTFWAFLLTGEWRLPNLEFITWGYTVNWGNGDILELEICQISENKDIFELEIRH